MRRLGASDSGPVPFFERDSAETFGEGDVSLGLSQTQVSNGSVGLGTGVKDGTTALLRPDQTASLETADYGVVIEPNVDLAGVKGLVASGATTSIVRVAELDGSILGSDTGKGPGETAIIEAELSAGTRYNLYQQNISTVPAGGFDDSTDDIDVIEGYDSAGVNSAGTFVFEEVTALLDDPATTGNATVTWPQPPNLNEWDAATFQASPDGETVEVYVEENDGTGWTEIAGPISRGDPIEAAPGSQVRFRVELSRDDTSNNPTLDTIYRRWVV